MEKYIVVCVSDGAMKQFSFTEDQAESAVAAYKNFKVNGYCAKIYRIDGEDEDGTITTDVSNNY